MTRLVTMVENHSAGTHNWSLHTTNWPLHTTNWSLHTTNCYGNITPILRGTGIGPLVWEQGVLPTPELEHAKGLISIRR